MDSDEKSLLFDLWQDEDLAPMEEAKNKIDLFFAHMDKEMRPGIELASIYEKGVKFLQPYDDLLLCINPEHIPYHNKNLNDSLRENSLVTIDCALKINGLWADGAFTWGIGSLDEERSSLLATAREAFLLAKELSLPGTLFQDVSRKLNLFLEDNPCSLVEACGGHGIGRKLHRGNSYIYANPTEGLRYPFNEAYTVEPVLRMPCGNHFLFAYFEETIIPKRS